MTTRQRDRNIAIHEAGHAVAAFFQHRRILRATIVPDTDTLGHVLHPRLRFGDRWSFDDSPRGIDRAEKYIVGSYAGPLASRKWAPRSRWRQMGASDFDSASEMLSRLAPHGDHEYNRLYHKLLWRRAELLVDLRWREIEAVADELMQKRTLDQEGVRAAIFKALGIETQPIGATDHANHTG